MKGIQPAGWLSLLLAMKRRRAWACDHHPSSSFDRFVYRGEGGNLNRFETEEDCQEVCVEPRGRDACGLPIVEGPCAAHFTKFGYNTETKCGKSRVSHNCIQLLSRLDRQCEHFIYGGCKGNNNKFEEKDECDAICAEEDDDIALEFTDKCQQAIKPGPCEGNYTR